MSNKLPSPALHYRLLSKITNRLSRYTQKVKTALNINTEYQYTHFSIALPADHLLPTYQKEHHLYDRFLPHLSKYIEAKSTVIDIGANCGDTLASMYDANQNLTYICVEADEGFFDLLKRNVLRIKAFDENASIHTVKALVGKNITNVSLEGSGGTKKAIVGDSRNTLLSQSIDDIVSLTKTTNIRLLKTDVDGFDYDVIDSAESILNSDLPIIFFECEFDHLFQKTGYEQTIANLQSKGYENWVIFDNFGEVVLRTNDTRNINQLLEYVWRQNTKGATRTIHYYDVLATTKKDSALIDKVIEDYIASN